MGKKKSVLPYGRQCIDADDVAAVARVLRQPFLTQGPAVAQFEQALCDYTGAKFCVAVSSGTAALHLAVAALPIRHPASGVTSPITFLATSNALLYSGLTPVFADIEGATVNMSPESLERVIRKDTKVVIPVHFAGLPVLMREVAGVAAKKKSFVIEDAAHAIGSRYPDGGVVGNCAHSHMTTFSFHPVKTITTGEGGAITTNDKVLYQRLLSLRSHGIVRDPALFRNSPGPWYHEMRDLGFNYRLTDIQAALGLSQLRKIGQFIKRRHEIVAHYNAAFQMLDWLRPVAGDDKGAAQHLYVVRIDFKKIGVTRKDFMGDLARRGVGSQVHYIPVYRQPFYRKSFKYSPKDYPQAEKYYDECLSLPLFPAMTAGNIDRVIKAVGASARRKEL